MHFDTWVWGRELVLTDGTSPYTIKLLKPKNGIKGCLSLQSHREKSEHWFVVGGLGVAQFIVGYELFTVKLEPGRAFYIKRGCIHRLGSIKGLTVLEMSTIDAHSVDKTKLKDVVRYHCFHGRECETVSDARLRRVLDQSVEVISAALGSKNFVEKKAQMDRLKVVGIYLGKLF